MCPDWILHARVAFSHGDSVAWRDMKALNCRYCLCSEGVRQNVGSLHLLWVCEVLGNCVHRMVRRARSPYH